jgi:hypothetical protein
MPHRAILLTKDTTRVAGLKGRGQENFHCLKMLGMLGGRATVPASNVLDHGATIWWEGSPNDETSRDPYALRRHQGVNVGFPQSIQTSQHQDQHQSTLRALWSHHKLLAEPCAMSASNVSLTL